MILDLYTDTGEPTADGLLLALTAVKTLRKLFERGTPHEVATILHSAVEEVRCETIIRRRAEEDKKRSEQHGGVTSTSPKP